MNIPWSSEAIHDLKPVHGIDIDNAMADMTNNSDNIIAEIDYQDLIQKIKVRSPKISTDIISLIEEITGTYHYRIYQIVCTLDQDLKAINNKLSSTTYFFNYINK
jgi:hypothetical protein